MAHKEKKAEAAGKSESPEAALRSFAVSTRIGDIDFEVTARARLKQARIFPNEEALRAAVELVREGRIVDANGVEIKKAGLVVNGRTTVLPYDDVRWLKDATLKWPYFTPEMGTGPLLGDREHLKLLTQILPERTALLLAKFVAGGHYARSVERFLNGPDGREFVQELIKNLASGGESLDAKVRLSDEAKGVFINAGTSFVKSKDEGGTLGFVSALKALGERLNA